MKTYPTLAGAYHAGRTLCNLIGVGAFAVLARDGGYQACTLASAVSIEFAGHSTIVALYNYVPARSYARAGWRRMDKRRRNRK